MVLVLVLCSAATLSREGKTRVECISGVIVLVKFSPASSQSLPASKP